MKHARKPLQKSFYSLLFSALSAALLLQGDSFFAQTPYPDDSVRCDGALAGRGDLQIKVKEKCGEPSSKIEYKHYTIIHNMYAVGKESRKRRLSDRYVLQYPETSDYLEALQNIKNHNHSHSHLVSDDDPHKEVVHESKKYRRARQNILKRKELESLFKEYEITWHCRAYEENFEEWTYNLGENRFIRIITFLRGRVVKIEHAGYGFDTNED